MLVKTLTEEEVQNLFYKHIDKEYFFQLNQYLTSGPSAILVLINKEEIYIDSNGMEKKYDPPIIRWKQMIGNKDPKLAEPDSLRKFYGLDIIKNEFGGSDNATEAYKELSLFGLTCPVKVI